MSLMLFSIGFFLLQKLFETNSVVDKLKMELVALEPELEEKSAATAEFMERLVKEQSMADKVRQIVLTDEAMVKVRIKLQCCRTGPCDHLMTTFMCVHL
jgi:hypothetical protein